METGRPARDWLVLYCCTENYHRISTLKQHKFTISQLISLGLESAMACLGSLLRVSQAEIKA